MRRRRREPRRWGELWSAIARLAVEHGSLRSRDLAQAAGIPIADASGAMWHHYKAGRLRRVRRAVYSLAATSISSRSTLRHDTVLALAEMFRSGRKSVRSVDLARALGIPLHCASHELKRQTASGMLERVGFGRYGQTERLASISTQAMAYQALGRGRERCAGSPARRSA